MNKKKIVLIVLGLLIMLLLTGCGEKKLPNIDVGSWNGNTYTNEQFGIKLELPDDDWKYKEEPALNMGSDITKDGYGSLVWATNSDYEDDVSIIGADISFNAKDKKLKDYVEEMLNSDKEYAEYDTEYTTHTFSNVEEETINGTKCYTYTDEEKYTNSSEYVNIVKHFYYLKDDFFVELSCYGKTNVAINEAIGYFK